MGAAQVAAIAPEGIDHIVEVAFAANISMPSGRLHRI